ncbi:hypothetical protein FD41_GL000861 [Lentilactobacillus farraginis DSM 18382 = JCM 14108]|nr:hypothetical protein FD41_GL000861 [Lentilactobacillus farraginis DSM 18382 = JCM 14108]
MRKPASDVAGIEEVNAKADTSAVDQLKTNLTNQVSTLQTQVDNSAVGTNLLLGTSSSEQSYTDSFSTVAGWSSNSGSAILEATNAGSTYTYSMYLTKLTGSFIFGYWAYDSNKKYIGWYYSGVHSSSGKVSWTFTVPSGISYIDPHVVRNSDDFTCTAKGEKLELGSHATDWCPNPDDKVNVSDMRKPANDVAGIEEVNAKQDKLTITPADDSKVAHLSGANNFDTTPTVNNNPLLLASSLPSDLARTGSDQEFTGKNTFDTAPIDKTTGKPYITKDGVPSDVARTGQDANFTGRLQKGGIDVATAADLKSVENSAWRIADLSSSNGLLKPKSFFYRIDDTNKTMYFLLPLMSTTSSYAPYSRLIDLSSIIHNVQSVSGYFLWSSAEYYVTSFAVIGAGDGAYIKNNSLLHIEQYNYLITTTPTNSVDSLKSYNGICSLTYDSLMNDN